MFSPFHVSKSIYAILYTLPTLLHTQQPIRTPNLTNTVFLFDSRVGSIRVSPCCPPQTCGLDFGPIMPPKCCLIAPRAACWSENGGQGRQNGDWSWLPTVVPMQHLLLLPSESSYGGGLDAEVRRIYISCPPTFNSGLNETKAVG